METLRATGIKKYLPNIMTCIRIFGTLALPFLMWKSWDVTITLPFIGKTFSNVPIIWIIAYTILISTDMFDGMLARKLHAESELGANLDVIGDTLVLAMGATLCFVGFVGDNLETWRFWLYVGMMILGILNRALCFVLAKIYHGKGNMVHTYGAKFFTIYCYVSVIIWAFLRTIPAWSMYSLLAIDIYAIVDESIYCVRTAEYNVNFKGHGFEKYKKREKAS